MPYSFEEFLEFKNHALTKSPNVDLNELKKKYDAWVFNLWKDGNGNEITNWKLKLNNTLPYIKELTTGYKISL